jgi:hypothetical protein
MTPPCIASVDQDGFRAEAVREDGDSIAVRFAGTADLTVQPAVQQFLTEVHEEVCRVGVPNVKVDMSALEFINSSCLKAFVTWITTVQSMANGRYKISFLYRPARGGARRSVTVLTRLAEDPGDT